MKMLSLGAGNMVSCDRIICIVSPDTAPVKRLVQDAKNEGRAIDVTGGKKTASVIVTDSDHVLLSKIKASKLRRAMEIGEDVSDEDEEND
jgi:regulator of extracellular matrix RemA (YlzA/DUF370 family)